MRSSCSTANPRRLLTAVFLAAALLPARTSRADFDFDVDLGIPTLKSGDLRLSGGLSGGWSLEHFGIAVRGGAGWYDFESSDLASNNFEARGSLEAFYLLGKKDAAVRGEARLTAGYAYTDVEYLPRGGSNTLFNDHTSNFIRGTLFVGGRLRLGAISARLLVGSGLQWESFNDLRVGQLITIDDTESVTFRLAMRAFVRWSFWKDWLSLRLGSEVERFAITRDESSLTLRPSGGTIADAKTVESTQWVVRSHLALEVDKLKFANLVPALFIGLQVYALSGAGASATSVVPLFGVAIAKRD